VTAGQLLTGAAGRYRLEEERASGGFGTTYLARSEEDGRAVLVKVLRLDRMKQWKALELFHREAAVLRHLSHPDIPAYLDEIVLGTPDAPEGLALVEELVPGTDLAALMRSGARADRERLLEWMEQLLRVLVYLHQQAPPVIHRDISPKNIVLRPDGRVALVDFGSVQAALQRDQSVASTAAGTFGFAPMEQFVGRASPSSDLYALGMTFLALATGLPPEQMPLDGIRVDVRALLGGDPRLVRLLEAMTAADPRERLGDAAAALRQLGAIRQGKDPGALETREGSRARRLGSARRILFLSGILGVALFVALEAYWAFWGATGTYYLVYAADADTGALAWKPYFRTRSRESSAVRLRGPMAALDRGPSLPADAYLCRYGGGLITYFTRGAATTFWVAHVSGGPPMEILRSPLPNRWESCALLLNGRRLAIESDDPPDTVRVLLQNEGDLRPAPGTIAGDHHPDWFPDGRRLAVSSHDGGRDALVALDVESGQREPLTTAVGPQQDIRPAVSPDGRRIAFYRSSRHVYGDLANRQTSAAYDLHVLDLQTKEARLLLQDVCFAAPPRWAGPELLAFGKWTDRHCGLYLYDLDSDQLRLVDNDY